MKILLILSIILISYSCSEKSIENNSTLKTTPKDSNINKPLNTNGDWAITMNETYMLTAKVSGIGDTPNGPARTSFELTCPSKENRDITFTFKVWNPDQISNFNFKYFEGPNAPALKEKLVEIQADSPDKTAKWKFSAVGLYGGFAEEIAFEFSPSTFNAPDRTIEFAQMIANGSTKVTITVFDNNRRTIKSTFSPISPTSEAAKTLNGCQM